MTRREFIERSATLAAGSLAARVSAAQVSRRPRRVAVIGVGRYHAFSPPNYLRILQTEKTDIVGVHDPDAAIAAKYAGQVGSTAFTDYRSLVEGEGVQLVAPGRPVETIRAPDGYLASWPGAVHDCLERIGRGEPPAVTARDCARAVSLTFDAYRVAGEV